MHGVRSSLQRSSGCWQDIEVQERLDVEREMELEGRVSTEVRIDDVSQRCGSMRM